MLSKEHRTAVPELVKVLLVEDDEDDFILTRDLLSQADHCEFRLDWVADYDSAVKAIEKDDHDVHLVDYRLGTKNGLNLLCEPTVIDSTAPIIMLTGEDEYDVAMSAMQSGAADYLVKGQIVAPLLSRAIRYAIARQHFLNTEMSNKKTLKEKNQRLSELYETAHRFVDNVSHEFRTPLTVIKEFSSIILDGLAGDINDQQREYLNIVINRVNDLGLMVDDLLDISKLEAGSLSVARKECGVEQIVEDIRSTLEPKAAARNVTLSVQIDPSLPTVYCDAEKIGRVIINLVINAFKFSHEGGHTTLKVHACADKSEVVFDIIDDGPGISPENLQAIFERFKQGNGDVRTSTKGFGLGLNIAKELVHLNFGDIEVKSELGKGSTFTFTVPSFDPPNILKCFLKRVECFRDESPFVSLVSAKIEPTVIAAAHDDVEQFLQQQLRRSDILICPQPGRWLSALLTNSDEPEQMIARLEKARLEVNRDRPGMGLPEINLELKGTWRAHDQGVEFVRGFEAEYGVDDTHKFSSQVVPTNVNAMRDSISVN